MLSLAVPIPIPLGCCGWGHLWHGAGAGLALLGALAAWAAAPRAALHIPWLVGGAGRVPQWGGRSGSKLQVVQDGGAPGSCPLTSRKGRAGGCRSVEQVCSEQGLAARFPMFSWQGPGSTGRSSFSAIQRLYFPWWRVMLSPKLKNCWWGLFRDCCSWWLPDCQ